MWAAAVTLSAGLIYLALMFIPQTPLPSTQVSVAYSPDFVYQMSKTAEVLYHWPPTNPGLSGVPLPYEWFLFFHMAAVSQVTHVTIPVIALRLDFVPMIVVVGCQLLMIGRAFAGTAATGAIAMAVFFLLGPLDLTTDSAGASPFFSVFSSHLWSSWTFPFGLIFFIALLYLIAERLRASTWRNPVDLGSWLLIALLMVGASGAKATVLPVLLAGTAAYAAFVWIASRSRPSAQVLVALGLATTIFLATFFIIYRGSAPFTGLNPLASLDRTLLVVDASHSSLPGVVAAPVLGAAYAAGLAGMLIPLAGLLYMLRRRHRRRLRRYALFLSMLGAGTVIANVFHQIGYSELYFQDTGYVAGCIVAADGSPACVVGHGQRSSDIETCGDRRAGQLDRRPCDAGHCDVTSTAPFTDRGHAIHAVAGRRHRFRGSLAPGREAAQARHIRGAGARTHPDPGGIRTCVTDRARPNGGAHRGRHSRRTRRGWSAAFAA